MGGGAMSDTAIAFVTIIACCVGFLLFAPLFVDRSL
jgi:hypothetical protein